MHIETQEFYEGVDALAHLGLVFGSVACLSSVATGILWAAGGNGFPLGLAIIGAVGALIVTISLFSGRYANRMLVTVSEMNDPSLLRESSAGELVEQASRYPRVGSYILARVTRVYSPYGTTDINTDIETPDGVKTWRWDRPVLWDADEDDSSFVEFAAVRGYSKEDFDGLEGEPVLLTQNDDTWSLRAGNPAAEIAEWIEDGELEWNEVELAAINDQFEMDIDIDGETVESESGIIVEDLPDEFVSDR